MKWKLLWRTTLEFIKSDPPVWCGLEQIRRELYNVHPCVELTGLLNYQFTPDDTLLIVVTTVPPTEGSMSTIYTMKSASVHQNEAVWSTVFESEYSLWNLLLQYCAIYLLYLNIHSWMTFLYPIILWINHRW